MLDAMLRDHAWHSTDVHVYDNAGAEHCRGDNIPAEADEVRHGWLALNVVSFGDHGEMAVSDDWPDASDASKYAVDTDASSDNSLIDWSSDRSSSDGSSIDSAADSSSSD